MPPPAGAAALSYSACSSEVWLACRCPCSAGPQGTRAGPCAARRDRDPSTALRAAPLPLSLPELRSTFPPRRPPQAR